MAKRTKGIVTRIVELGYGLPGHGGIMWFRVGAQPGTPDWDELLEAIARIDYGEFYGMKVASMLGFQQRGIGFSLVEFGREYSPALYLHFDSSRNEKLARGDSREIGKFLDMIRIEYGLEPDEEMWDPSRQCLRLWWD